jgi:hypothetical protein
VTTFPRIFDNGDDEDDLGLEEKCLDFEAERDLLLAHLRLIERDPEIAAILSQRRRSRELPWLLV